MLLAHQQWLDSDRRLAQIEKDNKMKSVKIGPVHLAWKSQKGGEEETRTKKDEDKEGGETEKKSSKNSSDTEQDSSKVNGTVTSSDENVSSSGITFDEAAKFDLPSPIDPKVKLGKSNFIGIDGVMLKDGEVTVGRFLDDF